MAMAILKNGREGAVMSFLLGICADGNLGDRPFPGDPSFNEVTFPTTTAGASQPCVKLQAVVAAPSCFTSINGLSAGDQFCFTDANGNNVCVPMELIGGVAQRVPSTDPTFTVLVGVAIDATLCGGNGYWTRGANNAQIDMPGNVLLYHEVVGHGSHHCTGDFNAADPEGQAIAEENILRAAKGLPTRTAHEGGCGGPGGGGGGNGCFIAGAAYGGQLAPEVQALRTVRDSVLSITTWGEAFFEEAYRHYYAISPSIARRMDEDPDLRELIRAILVEPWSIALRLFLALPEDPAEPGAAIEFADQAAAAFAAWARSVPLSRSRPTDPVVATADFVLLLELFANRQVRSALIAGQRADGFLPLRDPAPEVRAAVRAMGLPRADEAAVLGEVD